MPRHATAAAGIEAPPLFSVHPPTCGCARGPGPIRTEPQDAASSGTLSPARAGEAPAPRARHTRTHRQRSGPPCPRAAPRMVACRLPRRTGRERGSGPKARRVDTRVLARSLVSLSLSLCACGVPGGLLLARGLVSAMPPAAAVQRQCSGGRKDISDATSARHGWRGAHAESRSSRRAGGSLDSLHKAGACLGCPLSGHNQTSTKQNTEKVQRCSGYN